MVDWVEIAVSGVITFVAVFLAYLLALKQDRGRERREEDTERKRLHELFKNELRELVQYIRENKEDTRFPLFYDIWDSAKASGRLSLLTVHEVNQLSGVYVAIRALNHRIEGIDRKYRSSGKPSKGNIAVAKREVREDKRKLLHRIISVQRDFGWLSDEPGAASEELQGEY